MKILIAPMNWGLGHASRCIPLISKYVADGCEVVIAGDGESLALLHKYFPDQRTIVFPSLNLKYSKGNSQIWAIAKALPRLISWSVRDHYALKRLLATERFDRIISDNRFGLYVTLKPKSRYFGRYAKPKKPRRRTKEPETIYITHQLMIKAPRGWRWLEPLMASLHRHIILKYTHCWIPDYAGPENLSGDLSHKLPLPRNAKFIGPLTRFPVKQTSVMTEADEQKGNEAGKVQYDIVVVLSGLEQQRTLLEQQIVKHYAGREEQVLVVRGKPDMPCTMVKNDNITLVPHMDDKSLQEALTGAETILARSGYSTIMDLHALGCLYKARLVATPGQPEQEYLASLYSR